MEPIKRLAPLPIIIHPPERTTRRGPKSAPKKSLVPPRPRTLKETLDSDLSDIDDVLRRSNQLLKRDK